MRKVIATTTRPSGAHTSWRENEYLTECVGERVYDAPQLLEATVIKPRTISASTNRSMMWSKPKSAPRMRSRNSLVIASPFLAARSPTPGNVRGALRNHDTGRSLFRPGQEGPPHHVWPRAEQAS